MISDHQMQTTGEGYRVPPLKSAPDAEEREGYIMSKQRVYESIESKDRCYRPISRYIRIRWDSTGEEPYFIFNNRRVRINSLDYLHYPEMVWDADGNIIVIGMYETLCNFGGRLYELHPDGEYIRVWEEVDLMDR